MGNEVPYDVSEAEDGVGITIKRRISRDRSSVLTCCGRFIKHSAKQMQNRVAREKR